jgi:glyoxylase-like metal-dependent hydrolase (beta-lactamase superfamily II)
MHLAPGIDIIQTPFGNRPLNLVLITGRQVALIDTGLADTPREAILPALTALGLAARDLSLVIVTHAHADHFGGNEEILRASEGRARFAAHRLDTPWIEDPPACTRRAYGHYVDLGLMTAAELDNSVAVSGNGVRVQHVLEGGEVFDLGDGLELEIHFTPGHSAGHICVLERKHRVLIQGEAAAGVAQYDVQGHLLTAPYYEDLEVYLRSLAQIAGLDFATFVPSHLPVMDRAATARFLGGSLEFALRFEAEVRERLVSSRRPVPALELWRSLDRLWGQYPADLGLYMLLETHLNGLIRRGQAAGALATGLMWVGGAQPALDGAAEAARAAILKDATRSPG